ncbi:MAG: class I SAM-dependent methyltransferase, partial [Candidatus Krumholzibacteria bacterium]|nr:class I SAM-dependent methyltransferase [Candidatus Krumholzibacteria bacterium]
EHAYDRVVSPFDVHFLDDGDAQAFMDNCSRWLRPGGLLTAVFFNGHSLWNLNYRLARLLGRDPGRFRLLGYEEPISIATVVHAFARRFRVVRRRTISFLPPPNVGYLSGRMRLLPDRAARSLDALGAIPLVGRLGNIAIVDFEEITGASDGSGGQPGPRGITPPR